jgi:ubiquinone/menaquinone biosynthesis C-methylase UbiE
MRPHISIAGGDTATPLNLQKRVNLLTSRCDGLERRRMLDCGCGAGEYVTALLNLGWEATGIEFLPAKIQQAREAGLGPERVAQGDLEHLPFESNQFDVLLFNEVLEHVPSDEKALAEAHRVLAPDGHLFVMSPNRRYPFESHGVYLKGTKKKVPVWTPFIPYLPLTVGSRVFDYWARNYWPRELRALVQRAGFAVLETAYVWQTFEGISGDASGWLRQLRPVLRRLSATLERVPLVRSLGVTQFIHARKGRGAAAGPQ